MSDKTATDVIAKLRGQGFDNKNFLMDITEVSEITACGIRADTAERILYLIGVNFKGKPKQKYICSTKGVRKAAHSVDQINHQLSPNFRPPKIQPRRNPNPLAQRRRSIDNGNLDRETYIRRHRAHRARDVGYNAYDNGYTEDESNEHYLESHHPNIVRYHRSYPNYEENVSYLFIYGWALLITISCLCIIGGFVLIGGAIFGSAIKRTVDEHESMV